jgi:hypothetical protein
MQSYENGGQKRRMHLVSALAVSSERQHAKPSYDETLAGISGFEKMMICYSRPQNLREALTRTCSWILQGFRSFEIMSISLE